VKGGWVQCMYIIDNAVLQKMYLEEMVMRHDDLVDQGIPVGPKDFCPSQIFLMRFDSRNKPFHNFERVRSGGAIFFSLLSE